MRDWKTDGFCIRNPNTQRDCIDRHMDSATFPNTILGSRGVVTTSLAHTTLLEVSQGGYVGIDHESWRCGTGVPEQATRILIHEFPMRDGGFRAYTALPVFANQCYSVLEIIQRNYSVHTNFARSSTTGYILLMETCNQFMVYEIHKILPF